MTAGSTGARPGRDGSTRTTWLHGRAHLLVALLVVVSIVAGAVTIVSRSGTGDGGTEMLAAASEPSPSADPGDSARPTPGATPLTPTAPGPSPRPALEGADSLLMGPLDPLGLPGLPAHPGSDIVAYDAGVDGAVRWVLTEYLAPDAAQDDVREHYRGVLRDGAWFVGDVDYRNGIWSFAANLGTREVQLEINQVDGGVHVSVFVSDEVAPPVVPTPAADAASPAQPAPETQPKPRVQPAPKAEPRPKADPKPKAEPRPKPKPKPVRDRSRDDDDDDDGDDDGDDD